MDFSGLIANFGGIGWAVIAFIVALSVIVAIHEYGHYIVGRWCGIHADVFSIGFGPVIWSAYDKRGTKWQIAALPLGGYVKFMGDADAASGKDGQAMTGLSEAELKRTMHGADVWRRAATVAAGPVFNFIFSILVFASVFFFSGQPSEQPLVGEIKPNPGNEEQFVQGDLLVSVAGQPTPDLGAFYEVGRELEPTEQVSYVVSRDAQEVSFDSVFPFPPILDSLQPKSAAVSAGLEAGDVIQTVDGTPVWSLNQVRDLVQAGEGRPMELVVWRDGDTLNVTLEPRQRDLPTENGFETMWLIGFSGGAFFEPQTVALPFFDAVQGGAVATWNYITTSLSGLWHIASGQISTCNMSGAIGIAQASGHTASQGPVEFILFIAALSTVVGLINLFPIPVLDGGHLVFHAYEAVFRRPPNDQVLNVLMMGGLMVLLSVMVFALSRDIICV